MLIFLSIMSKLKKLFYYFSISDYLIWSISSILIISTFIIFNTDVLSFIASLIGICSLIFCARGNPIGPLLMVVFCVLYGIISLTFKYYGEFITYVCMSLPMSVICLVSWLKNPSNKGKSEVKASKLNKKDVVLLIVLSVLVTVVLYFVLKALSTPNLIVSTISVSTSFAAAFLSYKRSPFFALAYALNDIVLIALWIYATIANLSYLSTVIIFVTFLANDIYGLICWLKRIKNQY